MLGIGPAEFILLFFVALIVLGPKKLPGIARAIGRGVLQFKRAMNSSIDDEEEDGKDKTDEDSRENERHDTTPGNGEEPRPLETIDSPEESP
jgi:TatA/E family protein of Tat protein translocase